MFETGVVKEYDKNIDKTEAVFAQNPLNDVYEEEIYRTGNLVKYIERHELIYLYRKDFRIIRIGYRIDLDLIPSFNEELT